jgi:hypothetical protein
MQGFFAKLKTSASPSSSLVEGERGKIDSYEAEAIMQIGFMAHTF